MGYPNRGDQHTYTLEADLRHTIHIGPVDSGTDVISTPSMILAMELAAKNLLRPYLKAGEDSVGVRVDIKHLAPTPGHTIIETEAVYLGSEKSFHDFEVIARDESGEIGRGRHQRAIVSTEKFCSGLEKRHPDEVHIANQKTDRSRTFGNTVQLEIDGPTATLCLNRPKFLNAIDKRVTEELEAALDYLESAYPEVRACILKGSGRAFCAGEDIKENATIAPEVSLSLTTRRAHICERLVQLPQVLIAQVRGPCMGGGMALALSCDFIAASHDSLFAMPEIKLGWPPAYAVERLIDRVGRPFASELTLTGKHIKAAEAASHGLVWKVASHRQLDHEVAQLAEALLAHSPEALIETLQLTRRLGISQKNTAMQDQLVAYAKCRNSHTSTSGMRNFAKR